MVDQRARDIRGIRVQGLYVAIRGILYSGVLYLLLMDVSEVNEIFSMSVFKVHEIYW
jgi:hypothetical protein